MAVSPYQAAHTEATHAEKTPLDASNIVSECTVKQSAGIKEKTNLVRVLKYLNNFYFYPLNLKKCCTNNAKFTPGEY